MPKPQPGQQIVIICRDYEPYDADIIEHSAKGACSDCQAAILLARSSRQILTQYPGSIAICYGCAGARLIRAPHEFGGILPMQRAELEAHQRRSKPH